MEQQEQQSHVQYSNILLADNIVLLCVQNLQTPFVPNASGKLHTPSELYDPRVPELVALLDPETCFPAPAFCSESLPDPAAEVTSLITPSAAGAGEDAASLGFSGLAALQQLGLRSSADLGTLVVAAKFVERTAREGDEDMAVARGKVSVVIVVNRSDIAIAQHHRPSHLCRCGSICSCPII